VCYAGGGETDPTVLYDYTTLRLYNTDNTTIIRLHVRSTITTLAGF
jgi:hypothetical protein